MAHPLYLKRLLKIAFLSLVTLPVLGALLIGLLWLRSSLPHPLTVDELPAPHIDVAPRQASIPWKRDPDAPLHLPFSPAWLPWQKMPKGARPIQAYIPPPAGTPRVRLDPAEATTITDGLASPDPARRQTALDQLTTLLNRDPLSAAEYLRHPAAPWTAALLKNKSFDALDRATQRLLIACAYDTRTLESLCNVRVRTALAAGNTTEALDRCREWFAISTLYSTAPVLSAVEQTLTREHAPKTELRAFRASLETPPPASAPTTQAVPSLRVDDHSPAAAIFLAAARQVLGEDFSALHARGNLYLLAGRPDLARPAFRRAIMLATPQQLPAAGESLARCIKADTASILPANDFMEHQR